MCYLEREGRATFKQSSGVRPPPLVFSEGPRAAAARTGTTPDPPCAAKLSDGLTLTLGPDLCSGETSH